MGALNVFVREQRDSTSMMEFGKAIRQLMRRFGLDIIKYNRNPSESGFPIDFDDCIIQTVLAVRPFTQTSPERVFALCEAVKYIVANKIPGDIVECGIWKGGSMMAIARTLVQLADYSRKLYLFDTFEGMTIPTERDISYSDVPASVTLSKQSRDDESSLWNRIPLAEVKKTLLRVGYSSEKIHFVKGKVEDTLPAEAPESISLLRLDTDWYESTYHELVTLFPRISPGGVLMIDDYGHWKGARQAVDQYIQENQVKILLNRIDYTGRIGVVGVNDST